MIDDTAYERVIIADDRYYEVAPNTFYPSVTTILSSYPKGNGLAKWMADNGWLEAQRIKHAAGALGTVIHEGVEKLLEGKTLQYSDYSLDEWRYFIAFKNFADKYKPETVWAERAVISHTHKYAGTLDWHGYITDPKTQERKLAYLDWKTSNNLWTEYDVQLCAYERAAMEMGGTEGDILAIVQLGTSTKQGYTFHTVKRKGELLEVFDLVHKMWKFQNPHARPFEKEVPVSIAL